MNGKEELFSGLIEFLCRFVVGLFGGHPFLGSPHLNLRESGSIRRLFTYSVIISIFSFSLGFCPKYAFCISLRSGAVAQPDAANITSSKNMFFMVNFPLGTDFVI